MKIQFTVPPVLRTSDTVTSVARRYPPDAFEAVAQQISLPAQGHTDV
jgi:hypothetical protein